MPGEINVSLRRGVIKVTGEIPLSAGIKGLEAFMEEIEMNILGYTREKPGEPHIAIPAAEGATPARSDIPRTGLITKQQAMSLLGMKRSTFDNRVRAGIIPSGGKDVGRRVWDAREMWEIAEGMAKQAGERKRAPWLGRNGGEGRAA
jgi:predicted DNA-binding transcriptional regulator AlpA